MKNEKALRKKVKEINDILEEEFGIPQLEKDLNKMDRDPLDSLINTILSQNTNDVNRDKAYNNLRQQFPKWEDVLAADAEDIADAIRVGGLANQKSVRIKGVLEWIKENYGELNIDFICDMEPQEAIELFSQLKGVGLKTMNVVLAFACGRDVFPVDTHIFRITKRLDIVPEKATADKAHEIMGRLFPEGKAFSFHINLIRFGRTRCHARNPECKGCPLMDYCSAWPEFLED
ncbi:endonuclease III [Candidatus Poribacteria bacterium]|nr:endonuclease III [Candidatus Poribacteria bacterium]